jgi:hypothetical protein
MAHPLLPPEAAALLPLVSTTSGGDDDDEDDDDKSENGEERLVADELYGHALDDQDEAWVYRHLRSGVAEPVHVVMKDQHRQRSYNSDQDNSNNNNVMMMQQQALMLKPRTSDAVLSCPCCFTICCMDCQQHERYATQFRAMFVMNITVDWTRQLAYSDKDQQLIEHASGGPTLSTEQELYYSVHCGNCNTQVAALDNNDEIYHFFGCLVSA